MDIQLEAEKLQSSDVKRRMSALQARLSCMKVDKNVRCKEELCQPDQVLKVPVSRTKNTKEQVCTYTNYHSILLVDVCIGKWVSRPWTVGTQPYAVGNTSTTNCCWCWQ